jgi:hypothetical protein
MILFLGELPLFTASLDESCAISSGTHFVGFVMNGMVRGCVVDILMKFYWLMNTLVLPIGQRLKWSSSEIAWTHVA